MIFFLKAVKNQRFGVGQNKSVLNYHKLSMFQNKFLLLWRGVIPLFNWHLCFPKKSQPPLSLFLHFSAPECLFGFWFSPNSSTTATNNTDFHFDNKEGSRGEKCKLDKNLYRIYEITTLINLTFFVRLKVNLWQAGHDFY